MQLMLGFRVRGLFDTRDVVSEHSMDFVVRVFFHSSSLGFDVENFAQNLI